MDSQETIDMKYTRELLEKNEKDNRIIWLDIARVIAIFLVVLCHSIEAIYTVNWDILNGPSQIFKVVAFTISRLGVPIFLFISGKLLLSKKIENTQDCIKFYKKNLLPLLLSIEIWNILYNIFLSIFYNQTFNIKSLIKNILFFSQVQLPNMWYMPMIVGMYLAIPFLAILVKKLDIKAFIIPMIIVFISSFLIPNINLIRNALHKEAFQIICNFTFLGGEYGLYILLGYFIGNNTLKK